MKVIVFGANGKVGRQVVEILLSRGHTVRAFVHGTPSQKQNGVEYVQGDVYQQTDVEQAIAGEESVISCLGSWGTAEKDVLSIGMKHIVPAMESQNVTRIISLTGADARSEADHPGWIQLIMHTVFGIIAGKILRDGEAHMTTLARSSIEWTVLRSPVMNEKGSNGAQLNGAYPTPWETIHRRGVATALCDQLSDRRFIREAPYLHRP